MPLTDPKILAFQGVFELREIGRDQARDEQFIAAVRREFPHVQNRQILPAEAPLQAPHLILASQSAQLSLSALSAEIEIRFYGEMVTDVDAALEYAERKIRAVYDALSAVGVSIEIFGAVARIHYLHADDDNMTAPHRVLATLTKVEAESDELEDAGVKVALKVADTYFVHLTVENYETRKIEQALRPGVNLPIQQWRGTTEETGIELAIDVNNKWERRRKQEETEVSALGLTATMSLIRHLAVEAGPHLVETGEVSVSGLTELARREMSDA
ncbi:MAG TPA: hypothetical protein VGO66_13110 [Solirubrobacterales bacterium]|jgi:hypothetical protein|nr:hypothetical protein [Solirubrobacterales bacterium]